MEHKITHTLKTNKKPYMMAKIDMSKYFDRLNWTFVIKILKSFGFTGAWIN